MESCTIDKNFFNKYISADQDTVIKAGPEKRMVINAGPGTGKTWTLIERISYLIDSEGIAPDSVLVLCFSKSAVSEIQKRLKKAFEMGENSDLINYVDVRTFDSFAYRNFNSARQEGNYDIEDIDNPKSYDQWIKAFTELINRYPEIIENYKHLIVDEVQDLVDVRAKMLITLINKLPENAGITLLGDSCQAIFDYNAKNPDSIDSLEFFNIVSEDTSSFEYYYKFEANHRQKDNLLNITDNYRNLILSGDTDECDKCWDEIINEKIPEFNMGNSEGENDSLRDLIQKGTVCILTRYNINAVMISSHLCSKGFNPEVKRRHSDYSSLNKWVALVFNRHNKSSVSYEEFKDLYNNIKDSNKPDVDKVWDAIEHITNDFSPRIRVNNILNGLMKKWDYSLLYAGADRADITVSNVHRAKGCEYNTVLIDSNSLNNKDTDDEDSEETPETDLKQALEENRVRYVALTRAGENIYRINLENNENLRIFSSSTKEIRLNNSDNIENENSNKEDKRGLGCEFFGIGYLDIKSFVSEPEIQSYIINNYDIITGTKVILNKEDDGENYIRYSVNLENTGFRVGYTNEKFYKYLKKILKNYYGKEEPDFHDYPESFKNIYVNEVVSVVCNEDGEEEGIKKIFDDIVTWNVLSLVGIGEAL